MFEAYYKISVMNTLIKGITQILPHSSKKQINSVPLFMIYEPNKPSNKKKPFSVEKESKFKSLSVKFEMRPSFLMLFSVIGISAILYFFLTLSSAGYVYSENQSSSVLDEIESTPVKEIICSLTDVPPYYDCSKKWTLYLHDVEFPDVCNQDIVGIATEACTKITHFGDSVISATIHLGTQHGSQTSFPYPDGPEFQTILYHELRHAICDCTWHTEISHDFIN